VGSTTRDSDVERADDDPGPGLVVVFSGARPALTAHRVDRRGVVIGRELRGVDEADDRLSRAHARVRLVDGGFAVRDLMSRNGTHVAGARLTTEVTVQPPAVIRAGRTIAVVVSDVRRFEDRQVEVGEDAVVGPSFRDALARVERAARAGTGLLITGESGSGKEVAARAFHAATGARGPLVAVNCAAIPPGVAERLLFGTLRGAYSGAERDAGGYLAAADGGTLFLDEIAELDIAVQGKLLRVLETRELLPLGATRPRAVALRVVTATLRDLRAEVVARRFRDDLFFRIGQPEVVLPPLRERLEEVPWLIAHAITKADAGLVVHPSLVEAALLRPWPGNVRELLAEVRRAALAARDAGRSDVRAGDLAASAGQPFAPTVAPPAVRVRGERPAAEAVARALADAHGNVTRAARALGLHRNQLRRYLAGKADGAE